MGGLLNLLWQMVREHSQFKVGAAMVRFSASKHQEGKQASRMLCSSMWRVIPLGGKLPDKITCSHLRAIILDGKYNKDENIS